jgi:hypothetical protein
MNEWSVLRGALFVGGNPGKVPRDRGKMSIYRPEKEKADKHE